METEHGDFNIEVSVFFLCMKYGRRRGAERCEVSRNHTLLVRHILPGEVKQLEKWRFLSVNLILERTLLLI